MRISVFEYGFRVRSRRVAKKDAELMVSSGYYVWSDKKSIYASKRPPITAPNGQYFTYIPEKMPPREIPGCWFQLPQSDTWKLQHRMVSFPKYA